VIGLVADEYFSGPVVRGLRRRHPDADIVTVQEVGLTSASDPDVLEWAARQGRLVVSHDVQTMIRFANERTAAGKPMPGLIEAKRRLPPGLVIRDLYAIAYCSLPGEWEGQSHFPAALVPRRSGCDSEGPGRRWPSIASDGSEDWLRGAIPATAQHPRADELRGQSRDRGGGPNCGG